MEIQIRRDALQWCKVRWVCLRDACVCVKESKICLEQFNLGVSLVVIFPVARFLAVEVTGTKGINSCTR